MAEAIYRMISDKQGLYSTRMSLLASKCTYHPSSAQQAATWKWYSCKQLPHTLSCAKRSVNIENSIEVKQTANRASCDLDQTRRREKLLLA